MAMTIWGFQGTVSEIQWAKIMAGISQKYALVTGTPIVTAARQVRIEPRLAIGCGVAVDTDTLTTLNVAAPATGTGQWHLLVLRRTWGTSRTAQYMLIPGNPGPNANQSAPPTTFPAARQSNVGVIDDEPVAWIYALASTTTMQVWNLSTFYNTEWTDIVPTAPWSADASFPPQVRVKNGELKGRGRVTGGPVTNTSSPVFTLPPLLWPPRMVFWVLERGSASMISRGTISETGVVTQTATTATATGNSMSLSDLGAPLD